MNKDLYCHPVRIQTNNRLCLMKLLDRLRTDIRRKGLSRSTEKTYINWTLDYIRFHGKKHPANLESNDVTMYLNYLVNQRHVAPSTQNQALCAILFLYRNTLSQPDFYIEHIQWSKKPRKVPLVLSQQEVKSLLNHIPFNENLPIRLLYGGGLRVSEVIRLRIADIDFEHAQLRIVDAKGKKDRITPFPQSLHNEVRRQIERVRTMHATDLRHGLGHAELPHALHRSTKQPVTHYNRHYHAGQIRNQTRLNRIPGLTHSHRTEIHRNDIERGLGRPEHGASHLHKDGILPVGRNHISHYTHRATARQRTNNCHG